MLYSCLYFIYDELNNCFLGIKKVNKDKDISTKCKIKNEAYNAEEIKRKVKNQIGLTASKIFPLNWGRVYNSNKGEVKEMFYLIFFDGQNKNKIKIEHEWCEIDYFLEKIDWKENKNLLKIVLKKAIKNEAYFDKKERELK